jgi:transaldolase
MKQVQKVSDLKIKIFADGADIDGIVAFAKDPLIKGFTTNPSIMKKSGILDYEKFARAVVAKIPNHPISFEVFADDFSEMEQQALKIASWGKNVYVKIPVTNTKGQFAGELIRKLSYAGVKLNVTALLTAKQVELVGEALCANTPAVVSVFAGRIADTGIDPMPLMQESVNLLKAKPLAELLWASPREILNVFQADAVGCHIITVTYDMLKKLDLIGKNLDEYSLDTVKMFYKDALSVGYTINTSADAEVLV